MYLDHEGIQSLHDQVLGNRVIERTKRTVRATNKGAKAGFGFGILNTNLDAGTDASSSKQFEIYEKRASNDEQLLLELEGRLALHDGFQRIAHIRDVAELRASKRSDFVTGVLNFRWNSTFDPNPWVDAVKKEMVEFLVDKDSADDGGTVAVPIIMAGSLAKCVDRKNLTDGSLSPTSHLAIFLRHIGKASIRLGFFGHLQYMPQMMYLKPYAIWFP
jgi:hypothetical protein